LKINDIFSACGQPSGPMSGRSICILEPGGMGIRSGLERERERERDGEKGGERERACRASELLQSHYVR